MFNILTSFRPVVSGFVFHSAVVSLTPAVWTISMILQASTPPSSSVAQTKAIHPIPQARATVSCSNAIQHELSSSLSLAPSSPRTSLLSAEDGSIGQSSDVAFNDTAAVRTVMPWLCGMHGKDLTKDEEGEGESKSIDTPPSPPPSSISSSHSSLSPSSSASSHGLTTPASSFLDPLPIVEIVNSTTNTPIVHGKEAVAAETTSALGLQLNLVVEPTSSPSVDRTTLPITFPITQTVSALPTPTFSSTRAKKSHKNKAKKAVKSKESKQESVVVVASPPPSSSLNPVEESPKSRSSSRRKGSKRVPSKPLEPTESKVSFVADLVKEVEVVASTLPFSPTPLIPSPRLNRPRSSSSPTTLLDLVFANTLVETRCSSSSSSSLLVEPPTILLPIFLDLAADSPSPNSFFPFLDIDESIFPSLSPRCSQIAITQTSLQFELDEQGKFVRSNDVLPWSSVERVDPRIFRKVATAWFSGIRFLLFEDECRLAEYCSGGSIRTKEGRGQDWRVGGSPLRRSWVGEA